MYISLTDANINLLIATTSAIAAFLSVVLVSWPYLMPDTLGARMKKVRDEREAIRGAQHPERLPDRLAQPALDSIPDHASTERLRHCEANAGPGLPLQSETNSYEEGTGNPAALLVNLLKVGAPQQPRLLGEGETSFRA